MEIVGKLQDLVFAPKVGTDGSGGKFSTEPSLRSCGAGISVVNYCPVSKAWKLVAGASCTVPEPQTVPRSELTAVCTILTLSKADKLTPV